MEVPTVVLDSVPVPLPENLVVLDVREPVEWHHGHIEGAQHIPLSDVPARLGDVPTDRQVLVVCKVGGRSAQATGYLVQNGVDAVNLDGGMLEWQAAGRPMVSDSGVQPQVV